MKNFLVFLIAVLALSPAYSQHSFTAIIKDSATHGLLPGVNAVVAGTAQGASSDEYGELTISQIPGGEQVISFSFIGYNTVQQKFFFPLTSGDAVVIFLSASEEKLEEVIVEGTRSNKSIANIPTRVEVLTEEIDEAGTMDPSKVAHLLTHSTGIQVQTTSATSSTANVRIQGLDGRYTQILKDGFPLYGGFSGSLSIMQIPPLDLRQVEYIKGSASTLYGGGAISGLINLISKEPSKEEALFHINASQTGAFDINSYVSRKSENAGFTLLAQKNNQRYFDADNDGYTDLPQVVKYNFNPKLFVSFSEKTKLSVGSTLTNETREGGDTKLIDDFNPDSLHFYKELNDINRITSQVKLDHKIRPRHEITIRNSFSFFHRDLRITASPFSGEYRFSGNQLSSFSEIAYTLKKKENVLISGINFYSDEFKEEKIKSDILRNEGFKTVGAFANCNFDLGKKISLETGLRTDYVLNREVFILPRISTLFRWTEKLATRIGGGLGYRNPTIFNQEAELLGYKDVLPVDLSKVNAEESYGGNADIGFRTPIGEHFFININQMFFYSFLDKPLILADTGSASGIYHFINANGYTQSIGSETFFKFGFYDFVFFAGYTYTNTSNVFNGAVSEIPLTPRHSLKGDLLYSLPGKWRVGVDYEYKSSQYLSAGQRSKSYWTYGGVVEYTWKNITFFGNVENFTDVRQTRFESLRSAPYNTPQFTQVWAPLDGIVVNGGIKVRL